MNKVKCSRIILPAVCIVLIVLAIWTVWANTALQTNEYTIKSERIPKGFSGYRIAQISDLHNAQFGANNQQLLAALRKAQPDVIFLTGDLVDSYHTDIALAIRFVRQASKIAPCYYVTGNHEARIPEYEALKAGLEDAGVCILCNKRVDLERNGDSIALIGVDDPSFRTNYLFGDSAAVLSHTLQMLTGDGCYTILLSHRPELFDVYVNFDLDLVFSGHAHGGQIRLPFIGGLLAPNQGWFPKYDSGLYTKDATTMVVSRGIGNSIFPLRFNNRPEIIVVELQSE